ncbi:MAG: FMN-binding protein [Proteocatella sp.]
MEIIIILIALAIMSSFINIKFGYVIARSKIGRNLDMTLDGFTKAMIIGVVGIGILNSMPDYMEVEAYDLNQGSKSPVVQAPVVDVPNSVIKAVPIEHGSPFADGIFSGTGQGFKGGIKVEVEVVSGVISRVEVVDQQDDRKWFNWANNKIPNSIIEAQSADVDIVSGATYSSIGIIEGAEDAISQSRGE